MLFTTMLFATLLFSSTLLFNSSLQQFSPTLPVANNPSPHDNVPLHDARVFSIGRPRIGTDRFVVRPPHSLFPIVGVHDHRIQRQQQVWVELARRYVTNTCVPWSKVAHLVAPNSFCPLAPRLIARFFGSQFFSGTVSPPFYTITDSMGYLCWNCVMYLVLAWYADEVVPGDYGVKRGVW